MFVSQCRNFEIDLVSDEIDDIYVVFYNCDILFIFLPLLVLETLSLLLINIILFPPRWNYYPS